MAIVTKGIGTLTVHEIGEDTTRWLDMQRISYQWEESIHKYTVDFPLSTQEVCGSDHINDQGRILLLLPLGFVLAVITRDDSVGGLSIKTRVLVKLPREEEQRIWKMVYPSM